MRIVKDHDERRTEILDAAEKLFHTKGFEKCTVNDILHEVGIAKGTFYYYFKSKEEVLDAIVARFTELMISRVEAVLSRDVHPIEKLLQVFLAMQMKNDVGDEILDQMHRPENALLHQKTLKEVITAMAPYLAQIIEEGIKKEVWTCKYPLEYMQIFLAATITLSDDGIFETDADSKMKTMTALITLLEDMLGVAEGTFMHLFIQYWGEGK